MSLRGFNYTPLTVFTQAETPSKTDADNGSNGICRVIAASRSPSPDPKRSPKP
jgi:hypothetical protein